MKIRGAVVTSVLLVLASMPLLVSCGPSFRESVVPDLPVEIHGLGSSDVDLDVVMASAQAVVRQRLPQAYFRMIVFHGRGRDLPKLRGTVVLEFLQVRGGISKDEVLAASASVDTVEQTMNLWLADESDHYVNTRPEMFPGNEAFRNAARMVVQQLEQTGLEDCEVTMVRVDGKWLVSQRATRQENPACRFEPFGVKGGGITHSVSVQ